MVGQRQKVVAPLPVPVNDLVRRQFDLDFANRDGYSLALAINSQNLTVVVEFLNTNALTRRKPSAPAPFWKRSTVSMAS